MHYNRNAPASDTSPTALSRATEALSDRGAFRTLRVALEEVDISVRHRPSGKSDLTCIMLHGFGDGGFVWNRFATQLPPSFGACMPDLRGHGLTSWDAEGVYDITVHTSDMAALLPALNANRVVLIGHSLGGTVALRLCELLGEQLAGLVLVDCAPNLDSASREKIYGDFRLGDRRFASPQDYAAWLADHRPLLSQDMCLEFAQAALIQTEAGDYRRRCDPTMANAGRGLSEDMDRVLATLRRLRCQVLLVRGKVSGVLNRRTLHEMAAAGGTPVEGKMAGHAVMADNLDGFANAVLPFLADIAAEPARSTER